MNGFGGRLISMEKAGDSSFIYFKIPVKTRLVEFFLNAVVIKGSGGEFSILLNSVDSADERLADVGTPTSRTTSRGLSGLSERLDCMDTLAKEKATGGGGIMKAYSGQWDSYERGRGEMNERWTSGERQRRPRLQHIIKAWPQQRRPNDHEHPFSFATRLRSQL